MSSDTDLVLKPSLFSQWSLPDATEVSYEALYKAPLRGRSQTKFTRRGRLVVQKCPLFVNVYTIENVNTGG